MKTIADLADLATVSSAPVTELRTYRGRALALFDAATRHDRVEWQQAKGTTVALLSCGAGDYCVTVDGVQSAKGTIGAILDTVKQLSAALEGKPTPTARAYKQFGYWADVQDGYLVHYPMYLDGSWYEETLRVEYTCQHVLDRVNADFGTEFTMDDFEEGDCNCAV